MKFYHICFTESIVKMLNAKNINCSSTYFGPRTRSQVQHQFKSIIKDEAASDSSNIAQKLSKRYKRSKPTGSNKSHKPKLEVKWEPNNWRDQFENIRIMRKDKSAPVDTMGCERCTKEGYSEKVSMPFFVVVYSDSLYEFFSSGSTKQLGMLSNK